MQSPVDHLPSSRATGDASQAAARTGELGERLDAVVEGGVHDGFAGGTQRRDRLRWRMRPRYGRFAPVLAIRVWLLCYPTCVEQVTYIFHINVLAKIHSFGSVYFLEFQQ